MPWRTFLQGSSVLALLCFLGTFWCISRIYLGFDIPISTVKPHELKAEVAAWPELVLGSGWPHPFLSPKGLACHTQLGQSILVAETYAVHEVRLGSPGVDAQLVKHGLLKRALDRCLGEVPEFRAGGLRGLTMWCGGSTGSRCSAVLLGVNGHNALRCALPTPNVLSVDEVLQAPAALLTLHGGPWGAVAASAQEDVLLAVSNALSKALVHLRPRLGVENELVPYLEVPLQFAANGSQIHTLGSGAVVTLGAAGLMQSWSSDGGMLDKRQLPRDVRWAGMCSTPDGLYLAGTERVTASAAVWRSRIPAVLTAATPMATMPRRHVPREREVMDRPDA